MSVFLQQFPVVFNALIVGFAQTLKLFAVTLIGALPLGLVISFGLMNNFAAFERLGTYMILKCGKSSKIAKFLAKFKPISLISQLIVWFFRGTPLMLQLLIIYYFPGIVFGNTIWGNGEKGRFLASAIAFIINYACYFAEIYRSGIQGVPKGQQEAGLVLGLTKRQIFFKITLLQMVKRILPPMGNECITLVKDTSLARIIALQEIIWVGQSFLRGSHGIAGAVWPLFFTGVFYLIFTGILTLLLKSCERKLDCFRI